MAAYDPKRPRPSRPSDEPAPVEALLEAVEPDAPAATPDAPEPTADADAESRSTAGSRNGSGPAARPSPSAQEVPIAPAPEVGTTNRAVLYASLGVAALLTAVLIALRLRARRAAGSRS
jgi:hypothetical protein